MIKDIRAQESGSIFLSVLVGIMIFFAGMLVVNFIKTAVTDARNATVCTAPSTDGTKAVCLMYDVVVPYVFVLIISVAGGLTFNRFLQ